MPASDEGQPAPVTELNAWTGRLVSVISRSSKHKTVVGIKEF